MPGLDGFKTAALVKRDATGRHVPIPLHHGYQCDAELVFRGYDTAAWISFLSRSTRTLALQDFRIR